MGRVFNGKCTARYRNERVVITSGVIKLIARKVDRSVFVDGDRLARTNISSQTQLCGLVRRGKGKVRRQVSVIVQQRVPIRILLKFLIHTFICNSSDLIDRLPIIRGLRSALGSRVIRQRGRPESIVASPVALGLVTILVVGIPVVGIVYISRLS